MNKDIIKHLIWGAQTDYFRDKSCYFYHIVTNRSNTCGLCEFNIPNDESYCANNKVRLMVK